MQTEGAENTSRKQKLCLKKSCNKRSKWSQTRLFDTHCLLSCISLSSYTPYSLELKGVTAAEGTPIIYCKDNLYTEPREPP